MNAGDICNALMNLSSNELITIRNRCDVLLAVSGKGTPGRVHVPLPPPTSFVSVLYLCIADQHGKKTGTTAMSISLFFKLNGATAKKFVDGAEIAATHNGQWFPMQTKAQQLSMCMLYAELIFDYLAQQDKLVWPMILWAMNNLPLLVNRAFPGYAEQGLLTMVQEQRTTGLAQAGAPVAGAVVRGPADARYM